MEANQCELEKNGTFADLDNAMRLMPSESKQVDSAHDGLMALREINRWLDVKNGVTPPGICPAYCMRAYQVTAELAIFLALVIETKGKNIEREGLAMERGHMAFMFNVCQKIESLASGETPPNEMPF